MKKPLYATHSGELRIGEQIIDCAVLEDGTRVLTQKSVLSSIGYSGGKPTGRKPTETGQLPVFMYGKAINPFITKELTDTAKPIIFVPLNGGKAYGFKAEILPAICDMFLQARSAGALAHNQQAIAQRCEVLMRSFAKVGIVALVDEATGYQQVRDREALHKLLAVYLAEERLKWAKTFPDEFYRQIYRLKGWKFPGTQHRTPYIGRLTNEIIYERLPLGVLVELKKRNPTIPGRRTRKYKHFQFLSENVGQPDLRDHLIQVIALMRASKKWTGFKRLMDRAFPCSNQTELDIDIDED
jgi:hypothetical protein